MANDAISNHVREVQKALLSAGYRSEIFYEQAGPGRAAEGRPYVECDPVPQPDRLLLYHASTDSPMADWLVERSRAGQAMALYYHNITPAAFFSRWEPRAARSMEKGRRELAELVPVSTGALAVSSYNASELLALGQRNCHVSPLLLDLAAYHSEPSATLLEELAGAPLWLFVGRLAPNKCQHDVVAAFAVYRRLYEPQARLALVGGATSARYLRSIERMCDELDLGSSVVMPGSAAFPELLAYYRSASTFVCLSEHEGFCVPVVEAMELGVPVVCYRAAALTETVAGAGLLLDSKDPLAVAAAVAELRDDQPRRAELIDAGRAQAAEFSLERARAKLLENIGRLGAEGVRGASSDDPSAPAGPPEAIAPGR